MSGVVREWARVLAIAKKDLTMERRSKANFNAVAFFGAMMLMLFGFALGPDAQALRSAAAGILWLAVLFSGVLAFNRSFQAELDGDALEALLLYPGERWAIFVGKLLANLVFVLMVEAVVIPVAIVLYDIDVPTAWPALLGVILLGTVGVVALGTFYASMASRSRARDVLLPLLLFPMLVPVLLAAAQASNSLMGGDMMREAGAWIRLLVVFDVVFLTGTVLAFRHVIEV